MSNDRQKYVDNGREATVASDYHGTPTKATPVPWFVPVDGNGRKPKDPTRPEATPLVDENRKDSEK
jgi:hypothetical protein